jgi:predicted aspartyl protease
MQINGRWVLCEDGVVRPMMQAAILAAHGGWEAVEFLVDTGADRTVLSAPVLDKLGLPPGEAREEIGGLGGVTDSVVVEIQMRLLREADQPVIFRGYFTAVTQAAALDISVLGRDVLDLFAVIVDWPRSIVCLLSQRHSYTIHQA